MSEPYVESSDAYVETTVLTDILLKPESPKYQRAKTALKKYKNTLLPVYSIKEWKAGPLHTFAYLHNKLVFTKSFSQTLNAISALSGMTYLKSTAMEALAATATALKAAPQKYAGLGGRDDEMADSFRFALASLIIRSWHMRRKITTHVVDDLSCYVEVKPRVGKDGTIDLTPEKCDGDQECNLAQQLKSQPKLLEALRNAIPESSVRAEDKKRRKALKQLVKHPKEVVDRETCRDLGDVIFAFFCPKTAVVLTTNLRDHQPLANAIGKKAESP
jgi:hypothetical protein